MRIAIPLLLPLLLGACAPSPLLVPAVLPAAVVTGRAVEAKTGAPVAGALVLATADSGGFWAAGGSYLLGQAYTDTDGRYRIELESKRVINLTRPDTPITFGIFQRGYMAQKSSYDRARLGLSGPHTRDFQLYPSSKDHPYECPERYNVTACKLILSSWGWEQSRWGAPHLSPRKPD